MSAQPLSQLIAPDWADALAPVADRIAAMGDFLRAELAAGRGYFPSGANVLRAFTRPLGDVRVPADPADELQLFGVDVQAVDVVEKPFGVVDDATGGWAVPVSRRQRCHASPEASDQFVKLGEFGGAGAGQATSLG